MATKKIAKSNLFRGFSSVNQTTPSTKLTDIQLVKTDLLNTFQTRRGERVMRPTYGTIIWDMIFEPFTDANRDAVVEDVKFIISQEPRVQLQTLNVYEYEQGIRIDVDLLYVPYDAYESFTIDFDSRNNIVSTGSSTIQFIEETRG